MTDAVNSIFGLINNLISVLDTCVFDFYGFRVSIWSLFLVFIIVSMFANVWWKGANG